MTWAFVMRKQTECVSLCGCAVNQCLPTAAVIRAGVGPISPTAARCTITTPTQTRLLPASYQRLSDYTTDWPSKQQLNCTFTVEIPLFFQEKGKLLMQSLVFLSSDTCQLAVCASVNRSDDLLTLSELSTAGVVLLKNCACLQVSKQAAAHAASWSSGSDLTEIFEHH